jgi:hypothetical protein
MSLAWQLFVAELGIFFSPHTAPSVSSHLRMTTIPFAQLENNDTHTLSLMSTIPFAQLENNDTHTLSLMNTIPFAQLVNDENYIHSLQIYSLLLR